MNSTSSPISVAICLLINLTLFGASLAAGVALAFRFIPIGLPRLRYLIALTVFFAASIIPVLVTLGLPAAMQPFGFPIVIQEDAIDRLPDHAAQGLYPPSVSSAQSGMSDLSERLRASVYRFSQSAAAPCLFWLWLGISLLLMGRELMGHLHMARARHGWMEAPAALREQLSCPAWTRLYIDPHIGPCAVGSLRAAVILPVRILGGTTPAALRQITLHESCHARWRDPQINSLLRLLRAALWPSVPLWYLQHLIQMEREAAADQAAIAAGTPRKGEPDQLTLDYAAVLISIAQWPRNSRCSSFRQAAPHAGSRTLLENRVSRLLKESPHLSLTRSTFGVVALLSGFIGTAFLPAAVFDPAIPSSGNAARSIGGIPIRPDNQAEGPLLISCAGFTSIDNGRIQANVALLNNTSRRIAGFKMRLAHGHLPFERVFHIHGVKIEPRQSYLANLDWQQGHRPDWHEPNVGLLQVLEVQFEGDARAQSENLPARIVVNNPGGGTILVSKTASGEVEEPILKKSEAELTSSATERAAPAYPGGGISEQNSNAILVSVLIDESGNVIRAHAVAGNRNQLAQERAVEAARKWKFVPAVAGAVPIKEFGSLTFFGQMDFSRGWISIR